MKKITTVLALAVMFIIGGQAMAQTNGTMYLGATLPLGEFGEGSSYNSLALFDNQDRGGAGIGFNAGLKWDFGVGVKGLAVILSVDGMYNGFNNDMKDYFTNYKNELDQLFDDISIKTPKYINVPAMLGLRYTLYLNPQLGLYGEVGAGGNARFITDFSEQYKVTELLTGVQVTREDKLVYSTAYTLAWQAGLGIEVSKNLVLSCSLYNLGFAPVKGERTVKVGTASESSTFENGELNPVMVLGRIGFRF